MAAEDTASMPAPAPAPPPAPPGPELGESDVAPPAGTASESPSALPTAASVDAAAAPITAAALALHESLAATGTGDFRALVEAVNATSDVGLKEDDKPRASELIIALVAGLGGDGNPRGASLRGMLLMCAGACLEGGGTFNEAAADMTLSVMRLWAEAGAADGGFTAGHEVFYDSAAPFISTVMGIADAPMRSRLLKGARDFRAATREVRWRSGPAKWVDMVLELLYEEPLLVLHLGARRGYRLKISGIADCHQLETLLQGALLGSEEDRLLPGDRPSQIALDVAGGQGPQEAPGSCFGTWDMMQPWAVSPDGTALNTSTAAVADADKIWHEGTPSDIGFLRGERCMLLATPAYSTTWANNRAFDHIKANVELVEILSDADFDAAKAAAVELAEIKRAVREADAAEAATATAPRSGNGGGGDGGDGAGVAESDAPPTAALAAVTLAADGGSAGSAVPDGAGAGAGRGANAGPGASDAGAGADADAAQDGAASTRNTRPEPWDCPGCGAHNEAHDIAACASCGSTKPGVSTVMMAARAPGAVSSVTAVAIARSDSDS